MGYSREGPGHRSINANCRNGTHMSNFTKNDQSMTASAGAAATPPQAAKVMPLSLREGDRAVLRPMVVDLEGELASLQAQTNTDGYSQASVRLAAHWRRLVDTMALGMPPEQRSCPHCGYGINASASRCIQCWKQSDGKARQLP